MFAKFKKTGTFFNFNFTQAFIRKDLNISLIAEETAFVEDKIQILFFASITYATLKVPSLVHFTLS